MLDLGDPITLTLTVKVGGVLTDAAPVVLALKSPSGVVTTPTVTHASTGTYTATVLPDAVGVWREKWTTGAAGQGVVNRSFTVEDPFSDVGTLLSLDDAKQTLNITDTAQDDELGLYIATASEMIADLCGPILPTTITGEVHYPTGGTVILNHFPVISVTSLSELVGVTPTALTVVTDQALSTSTSALLDPATGVLTRLYTGSSASYAGTVEATYIAGYTTIPARATLACRQLVEHLFGPQRGQRMGGVGETALPGYGMPNLVKDTLGALVRGASIA